MFTPILNGNSVINNMIQHPCDIEFSYSDSGLERLCIHCGVKCLIAKTPQVMATFLVNDTSDIDGLPHL